MSPENRELLEVGGGVKNPETVLVFHIPRAVLEELFDAARAEERARAAEVVRPFVQMGRLIDGPFGPRGGGGTPDDGAFRSGGAWSENGEKRTVTWGDFRRAAAYLAEITMAPKTAENELDPAQPPCTQGNIDGADNQSQEG